jgi:hypothetical protein
VGGQGTRADGQALRSWCCRKPPLPSSPVKTAASTSSPWTAVRPAEREESDRAAERGTTHTRHVGSDDAIAFFVPRRIARCTAGCQRMGAGESPRPTAGHTTAAHDGPAYSHRRLSERRGKRLCLNRRDARWSPNTRHQTRQEGWRRVASTKPAQDGPRPPTEVTSNQHRACQNATVRSCPWVGLGRMAVLTKPVVSQVRLKSPARRALKTATADLAQLPLDAAV